MPSTVQPRSRILQALLVATTALASARAAGAQQSVGDRFNRPACSDGTPVSAAVQRENLRVVREFVRRGLGEGDLTAFDEYVAPNAWVSTGLKPGAPILGRAEWKEVARTTLAVALSPKDADMRIDDALVTTDGRVIIRFAAHANQTGMLHGVPATNRRLTLAEIHLFCVRDGKIVEDYVGGLNPLQWEMIYSDHIRKAVLP